MSNFPTGFAESAHCIEPIDVLAKHARPFLELENRGFVVVAGLRRHDVADLAEIAGQLGTREFCPNDLAKRWGDESMAEVQLAKDGGRGVFRLESREDGSTKAFGWTGRMSDDERKLLPGCENTFALRVHESMRGQRLATPFSRAIVAGSIALFGANKIGLETWGSNTAAVKSYLRAGAKLITTVDSTRPTLIKEQQDFLVKGVPSRRDVRQYMQFAWPK